MDQISSLDWIEAAGVVATAFFTGVMAYFGWRNSRRGLVTEWDIRRNFRADNKDRDFHIRMKLRNSLPFAVRPWLAEVSGVPVRNIKDNRSSEKHESWANNQCGLLGDDVEPDGSAERSMVIFVDWASLSKEMSKRWFFKSSATMIIRITVSSKASSKWRRRITMKTMIPAEIIERKVANVAQK